MTERTPVAPPTPLDEAGRALLFTEARSANRFADTPIERERLAAIWDLLKWAPTSSNTLPMRVLFVDTDEAKQRLAPHMNGSNAKKMLGAPVTAVLAFDTRFHEFVPTLVPHNPKLRDVFEAKPGMREETGRFSAALQAGYFIIAARALGLVAGPMGGFDADGIDGEFFADGRWKSILTVALGLPVEDSYRPRASRLDAADAVRFAE